MAGVSSFRPYSLRGFARLSTKLRRHHIGRRLRSEAMLDHVDNPPHVVRDSADAFTHHFLVMLARVVTI
jgi:hypothetical protein